jgi:hypothetical protein
MENQTEFKKKRVSYSQYSMYLKCPQQYYLNYILGKKVFGASINTCFGTAIHHVLQTYITTLYTQSPEIADGLNLPQMFHLKFKEETDNAMAKDLNLKITEDEYKEFSFNAEDILKVFTDKRTRQRYFPDNRYEFIGTELPLDVRIKNNVEFIAYVDLVLKDKVSGKIKIWDFKTSTMGWRDSKKQDRSVFDQILIYKAVYSKKFNVPLDMIDVEFFILKRKLYENVNYEQKHIQIFIPAHDNPAIADTLGSFTEFVTHCFNPDGTYRVDASYPKVPGERKKNCEYCHHHKTNCDGKIPKVKKNKVKSEEETSPSEELK